MDIWNIADVDWGADEAKGDENLLKYFVPVPEYDKLLSGRYRYVVGRKGTGKTAICERIRLFAEADPLAFSSFLSLRNFPLASVRDLRDKSYRDKSQFAPVWMFAIGVELARMVLTDEGAGPHDVVANLREFLKRNFGPQEQGFIETVTRLQKNQAKVNVSKSWLGGELGHERSEQVVVQVHYHSVTQSFFALLAQVRTASSYYMLMDELDEGFRAGDSGLRLILLALLRATEDAYVRFKGTGLNFRPVLVLRSDIFDSLEDNDLNKHDDYMLRLKWYSRTSGPYNLRDIVDARVRASLRLIAGTDPWTSMVDEDGAELPRSVDSIWSYICSRTFERPRDLIKFLKLATEHQPSGRLRYRAVEEAENAYSAWLYRELRDEIHTHLPVWKEALQALTRIGRGKFATEHLRTQLLRDKQIVKWLEENGRDPDQIIATLFDFGVIGTLNKGIWLFKHKDDDLSWDPEAELIVHYGFHKKLRVFR